jgi:predicted Fe-Mo cluster-binding NifX family protein
MKKIVLTANDDRGLDGTMSMHFGHCTHFVVVEVDAGNRVAAAAVQPNPYAERHEPGQIPRYIAALGADVVVAGGMGSKAIDWFRQAGVEVVTGARRSVAETLDAYLGGAMTAATQCRHEH